jgi:CheY-like chemotaxis protein
MSYQMQTILESQMPVVLVIEDSSFQRKILCKFITDEGYQVCEASNGKIGLELVASRQPDLIFCDLVMPELDGFEVLKKLQEMKSTIPIVILTSDIQEPVKKQCLELGALEFINKPSSPVKVQGALQKAFGS